MFDAWKAELPEHILRGFYKAKGTEFQLRVIYEWDRRGMDPALGVEAYIAAGGSEAFARENFLKLIERPGPRFLLRFLQSEPPEVRFFRIEDNALKACEKALSIALSDEGDNDKTSKVIQIARAIRAFVLLMENLPHLAPEARKLRSKIEMARAKLEPRKLSIEEIDEAIAALQRERARLEASKREPEAPSH